MSKFTIKDPDSEFEIVFLVDGIQVGAFNDQKHGWATMMDAMGMFEKIAKLGGHELILDPPSKHGS